MLNKINLGFTFFVLTIIPFAFSQTTSHRLIEKSNKAQSTNFDSAIFYSNSAIKQNTKKDSLILCQAYKNIGMANYYKGNYPAALEFFQKATKIAEANKNEKELLQLYNLFGTFYKKQNNLKSSLESFTAEYELSLALRDSSYMASALNDIGLIYQLKSQNDKAFENFKSALKIYETINDSTGMSYSLNYLSEIYASEGKFNQGIDALQKALAIRENLKDKVGIAININNIGEVYLLKKDYENALKYLTQSLALSMHLKIQELTKHIYKLMSDIYVQQKDFEKAYKYQALHVAIKDSIYTEQNARIVNEMESKYQSQRKQQQIELFSKDKKVTEAELKNQKLIRNTLIIGSLIICLLAFYRARLKQKANEKLSNAYSIIEEKNKDITDSIKYAKRIQEAILPPEHLMKSLFPESFVLYKPKDIVCGDFYWMDKKGEDHYFAAVDCTGHGVPGAFMSLVGHNHLNQAVNERNLNSPASILNDLNKSVTATLRQTYEESSVRDGMDIALCCLNTKKRTLQFAGANNHLWLVRNMQLKEIKGDKFPIGIFIGDQMKSFTNHEIPVETGDVLYVFSDGYADQFGGKKGKKFMAKNLKELFLSIADKPMAEQKEFLNQSFINWKGNLEQVDDVCVIGVRI